MYSRGHLFKSCAKTIVLVAPVGPAWEQSLRQRPGLRLYGITIMAFLLTLLAACGPAAPTATPIPPPATAVPATSEPAATTTARVPTVVPPTEVGAAALGEAPAPGEAVIWYLGHCGYAVRTQNHFLVFDYRQRYDGPEAKPRPAQPSLEKGFVVPEQLADLRVRVFVSHQHTDHYDPSIFTWQQTVSDIAYFLGWQARETDDPAFHFLVGPRAAWQSGDMEVYTINSHHSDVPEVAYLVKVDGLVIYHNGDYQGDFRQDYPFLREISAQIDLAFVPNDYDEQSPYYFPQNVDLFQRFAHRAIFPMHDSAERGHYADFARVYLARLPGLPIHYPQRIGERFLFQDGRIVGGGPAALSLEQSPQRFGPRDTFQVVLGDVDGDGDLDAVFSNMGPNHSQVWLNDGSGRFVDSGQELTPQGHGAGLGDLDGDGDLDLFISCATYSGHLEPSKVYLNDGTGVFRDSGQDLGDTELSGTSVDLIDIDTDGDLDACVMYYEQPYKIYLNDGHGTFAEGDLTLSSEAVLAWGDLDGDGDVDLLLKERGQGYRVMLNDGAGHLADHWRLNDRKVIWGGAALGDLDGDGDLDAVVANGDYDSSYPTIVLFNDGEGRFSDSGQQLSTTRWGEIGLADLDGDGDLDAFITNFQRPDEVWLNDGRGYFHDGGLRLGGNNPSRGCAFGDLDADGDIDVFVASFGSVSNVIWLNGE